MKNLLPMSLRNWLREQMGVNRRDGEYQALLRRIERLENDNAGLKNSIELLWRAVRAYETRSQMPAEEKAKLAQTRWKEAKPEAGLTWGFDVSGDAFVKKLDEYEGKLAGKRILEVGPGYGRLPKSLLAAKSEFASYLGLDISETNVKYLKENFTDSRMEFRVGDVQEVEIPVFDVMISSLVLKHLHPTFERAIANMARYAAPGARLYFDVIEGDLAYFEVDGVTYIRMYRREEIPSLLENCGFKLKGFDEVHHVPGYTRLLVIAEKI